MAPKASGDRSYHHAAANGKVVAAKVPGTPRKETSSSRDRSGAVQDPGLKDYVRGQRRGRERVGVARGLPPLSREAPLCRVCCRLVLGFFVPGCLLRFGCLRLRFL